MNPAVLIGAGLGLVVVALVAGKASGAESGTSSSGTSSRRRTGTRVSLPKRSSSSSSTTGKSVSLDLAETIAKAIASNSPAVMREIASQLEALGYKDAAHDLRMNADYVEAKQEQKTDTGGGLTHTSYNPNKGTSSSTSSSTSSTSSKTSSSTSSTSKPTGPLPDTSTKQAPPEDPQRALARELTAHLWSFGAFPNARYKLNKELVKRFQVGEKDLTADGVYGPGTSMRILDRYGIIPMAALLWSKTNAAQQKSAYISRVRTIASGDPQRSAEYETLIRDTQRS